MDVDVIGGFGGFGDLRNRKDRWIEILPQWG